METEYFRESAGILQMTPALDNLTHVDIQGTDVVRYS
jgi:hypothetical protein